MSSPALSKFSWLSELSPRFLTCGRRVKILKGPGEYFEGLKTLCASSRRRIVLASLYLGTGAQEAELVACIRRAVESNQGDGPRTKILLDFCRGTRGAENSCTLLAPLLRNPRLSLHLYQTPLLRGWRKALMPSRWNEIFGVQHMKIGVFDDSVLISGANLSESYFTNRQDRYVLLENCPQLADFYEEVVDSVSKNSFGVRVGADGEVKVVEDELDPHPVRSSLSDFASGLGGDLEATVEKWKVKMETEESDLNLDTAVYPLFQGAPVGVDTEDFVIRSLLTRHSADPEDRVKFASGYFNIISSYEHLMVGMSKFGLEVLAASPRANGFFQGGGLSVYVPAIYTHAARLFFDSIRAAGQEDRIRLFEFHRTGWTFHAKGIWWTLSGEVLPSLTLVGSSNFGYRSAERDLEAQMAIVTESPELRQELAEESRRLFTHSTQITLDTFQDADHYVPFFVSFLYRFIRSFF